MLNEYSSNTSGSAFGTIDLPPTISEEGGQTQPVAQSNDSSTSLNGTGAPTKKVKRTPRELYKVTSETSPLLDWEDDDDDGPKPAIPGIEDDSVESGDKIVKVAIYVNLAANTVLLAGKIAVIVLTSSLSVLASLVDAALDFLSTAIVWTTAKMIESSDSYQYPVGRRRLEPIGVLVFSVIMVTSFFQVALVSSLLVLWRMEDGQLEYSRSLIFNQRTMLTSIAGVFLASKFRRPFDHRARSSSNHHYVQHYPYQGSMLALVSSDQEL